MTDRCQLCEAAPHPNCDASDSVWIEAPFSQLEGEVRVCIEHYDAIEKALSEKEESK